MPVGAIQVNSIIIISVARISVNIGTGFRMFMRV
jgi:hypothetical protein